MVLRGNKEGFFYYTSEHQRDIPIRKTDTYDGATPSANALMAHNLWICGMCMEKTDWIARAGNMLKQMSETTVGYSYSFGYWALLLQRHLTGMKTIICTGNEAHEYGKKLQAKYLPQAYLVISQKKISEIPILEKKIFTDKMYIFVCSEQACLSPVSSVDEALRLVD